jgi:hypothetical protein
MGTVVAITSPNTAYGPSRSVGYTSDGVVIACVPNGASQDLMSLKISQDDGATWTDAVTGFPGPGPLDMGNSFTVYSMCVDSNDDIHVVWNPGTGANRCVYQLYERISTAVWAPSGFTQEVYAVADRTVTKCDVDVLDDGTIVVVWGTQQTTGSNPSWIYMKVKPPADIFGAATTLSSTTTGGVPVIASVARNLSGLVSGSYQVAYAVGYASGGLRFAHCLIDATTHAISALTTVNTVPDNYGTHGIEDGLLFSRDDDEWCYIGRRRGASADQFPQIAIRFNQTAFTKSTSSAARPMNNNLFSPSGFALTALGHGAHFYAAGKSTIFSSVGLSDWSGNGPDPLSWYGVSYIAWAGVFQTFVGSGGNRNIPTNLVWITRGGSNFTSYTASGPTGATVVAPADGATINTSRPLLRASMTLPVSTSGKAFARFRLANDVGLSTNIFNGDSATGTTADSWEVSIPLVSARPQATQYIRMTPIDAITGAEGTATAVGDFLIAHLPSAIPTSPLAGVTVAYAATTPFSWLFSDPYPDDTKTAHRVAIELNSDGSGILDTGKVVNTALNASLAVGSGNKDLDLRWRVKVWDANDVEGPWSSYSIFRVSDPPVIAITAPVDAGTVDNPQPTIDWTFTADGGRTQSRFYLAILEQDTSEQIYISGWVSSSLSETQLSAPVLVNNTSYLAFLAVEDSVGLVSLTGVTFEAVWTPPTAPLFEVEV